MDEIYTRICNKLGCEPRDVEIPYSDTEDDNTVERLPVGDTPDSIQDV